jgi:hypothetical protein
MLVLVLEKGNAVVQAITLKALPSKNVATHERELAVDIVNASAFDGAGVRSAYFGLFGVFVLPHGHYLALVSKVESVCTL